MRWLHASKQYLQGVKCSSKTRRSMNLQTCNTLIETTFKWQVQTEFLQKTLFRDKSSKIQLTNNASATRNSPFQKCHIWRYQELRICSHTWHVPTRGLTRPNHDRSTRGNERQTRGMSRKTLMRIGQTRPHPDKCIYIQLCVYGQICISGYIWHVSACGRIRPTLISLSDIHRAFIVLIFSCHICLYHDLGQHGHIRTRAIHSHTRPSPHTPIYDIFVRASMHHDSRRASSSPR